MDHLAGMEVDFHLGMIYLHQGRTEEARRHYKAYEQMCKKLGLESALAIAYLYESLLMSLAGDQGSAMRLAEESKDIATRLERAYLKAGSTAMLSHAHFVAGDLDECRRLANEAMAIADNFDRSLKTANIGLVRLASAEEALVRKDWSEAEAMFKEAISTFQATAIGKLMEALSQKWYGEALIEHRDAREAEAELKKANNIFLMLRNEAQSMECERALAKISRSSNPRHSARQ